MSDMRERLQTIMDAPGYGKGRAAIAADTQEADHE
jgi:hypothetical protein